MPLPKLSDYNAAVQNPRTCFTDPELQQCQVETTPLGLPRARSGGSAITYRLYRTGREWAVRCFHREVPELQHKYAAISAYLGQLRSPLFESFEYQAQGIRVGGSLYPIVKMGWVKGQTLGSFIEGQLRNPAVLVALAETFRRCVLYLEQVGIAHGDLQHGNIMVLPDGNLRLIDYDGMYVPGIQPGTGHEKGHVNYQHPARDAQHFGPHMDRFSAICIYVSLNALGAFRELWHKYNSQENIIFSATDFADPDASRLFAELCVLPGVQDYAERFRLVCRFRIEDIPTLEEFIQGKLPTRPVFVTAPVHVRRQYPLVDASDTNLLLQLQGQVVEIVGRITDMHFDFTQFRHPYVFLNFGNWKEGCFYLVLWVQALDKLRHAGISLKELENHFVGKWVSMTGLLETYASRHRPLAPQMIVENPLAIRFLTEVEARELLRQAGSNGGPPGQSRGSGQPRAGDNKEMLRQVLSQEPRTATTGSRSTGSSRPPAPVPRSGHGAAPPARSTTPRRNRQFLENQLGPAASRPPVHPQPAARGAPPAHSGKCFIATAVYGSEDAEHVAILRRWRDAVLRKTGPGRLLIGLYDRLSPPMARWVAASNNRLRVVRWLIRWIVRQINASGQMRPPLMLQGRGAIDVRFYDLAQFPLLPRRSTHVCRLEGVQRLLTGELPWAHLPVRSPFRPALQCLPACPSPDPAVASVPLEMGRPC